MMTNKDKKAKKRVDDEIKLKTKISELLRDFSKEYDVELVSIDIQKNNYYPDNDTVMYNMDLYWKFDYLGHPEYEKDNNIRET